MKQCRKPCDISLLSETVTVGEATIVHRLGLPGVPLFKENHLFLVEECKRNPKSIPVLEESFILRHG